MVHGPVWSGKNVSIVCARGILGVKRHPRLQFGWRQYENRYLFSVSIVVVFYFVLRRSQQKPGLLQGRQRRKHPESVGSGEAVRGRRAHLFVQFRLAVQVRSRRGQKKSRGWRSTVF